MEPKPLSQSEIVKKELKKLHVLLGNFQRYMAYKESIPPRYEGEVYESISSMMEMVENEVEYQHRKIKDQAIDTAVERSWEHSFPVQRPPQAPPA